MSLRFSTICSVASRATPTRAEAEVSESESRLKEATSERMVEAMAQLEELSLAFATFMPVAIWLWTWESPLLVLCSVWRATMAEVLVRIEDIFVPFRRRCIRHRWGVIYGRRMIAVAGGRHSDNAVLPHRAGPRAALGEHSAITPKRILTRGIIITNGVLRPVMGGGPRRIRRLCTSTGRLRLFADQG